MNLTNLTYPNQEILYNSLSATKIGVYTDSVTSKKKLLLKDMGVEIPWDANNTSITTQTTTYGVRKSKLIKLRGVEPASIYEYEYGVRVVRKFQFPAVNTQSEFKNDSKFYGSRFPKLTVSAGSIADADLVIMEDEIIKQITGDTGYSHITDGAVVDARRVYYIDDSTANHTSDATGFTVTFADGTTYAFAIGTTFTAGQIAIQFNANSNVNTLLRAYRVGTNKYAITSINAGYSFTIGTEVAGADIDERFIELSSKWTDPSWEVELDPIFATQEKFYHYNLYASSYVAATQNVTINVNGTDHSVASSTNIATVAAAVNSAVSTHGVWATYDATTIYVAAEDIASLTNILMTIPDGSTLTIPTTFLDTRQGVKVITQSFDGTGRYDLLAYAQVYHKFMGKGHDGDLSMMRPQELPEKNVKYKIYNIYLNSTIGGGAGANHSDIYTQKVSICVKKSETLVDYFTNGSWMDDAGAAPDRTFEELLTYWQA